MKSVFDIEVVSRSVFDRARTLSLPEKRVKQRFRDFDHAGEVEVRGIKRRCSVVAQGSCVQTSKLAGVKLFSQIELTARQF